MQKKTIEKQIQEVRLDAAEALIAELSPPPKSAAAGNGKIDDGRKQALLSYALRRLVRGLASPRGAARQGFATALSAMLASEDGDRASETALSVLDAIDAELPMAASNASSPASAEKNSSSSNNNARDASLGRAFALAAVARSGACAESAELSARVAEALADAALRGKSYSREAAAAGLAGAAGLLSPQGLASAAASRPESGGGALAAIFSSRVDAAAEDEADDDDDDGGEEKEEGEKNKKEKSKWSALPSNPVAASPEAALIALRLWPRLPSSASFDCSRCAFLPRDREAPRPAAGFFDDPSSAAAPSSCKSAAAASVALFSSSSPSSSSSSSNSPLTSALVAAAATHPRLHRLWTTVLALLLPGFDADGRGGAGGSKEEGGGEEEGEEKEEKKNEKKKRSSSSFAAPDPRALRCLWRSAVDGGLLASPSATRRAAAIALFCVLLPSLCGEGAKGEGGAGGGGGGGGEKKKAPSSSSPPLTSLLTPAFVKELASASRDPRAPLHAAASRALDRLVATAACPQSAGGEGEGGAAVSASPSDFAAFAARAAGVAATLQAGAGRGGFDARAGGRPVVNKLLASLDRGGGGGGGGGDIAAAASVGVGSYVRQLLASFERPLQEEAGEEAERDDNVGGGGDGNENENEESAAASARAALLDQVVAALPRASAEDRAATAAWLASRAFSQGEGEGEEEKTCQPPLDAATRRACAARLVGLVSRGDSSIVADAASGRVDELLLASSGAAAPAEALEAAAALGKVAKASSALASVSSPSSASLEAKKFFAAAASLASLWRLHALADPESADLEASAELESLLEDAEAEMMVHGGKGKEEAKRKKKKNKKAKDDDDDGSDDAAPPPPWADRLVDVALSLSASQPPPPLPAAPLRERAEALLRSAAAAGFVTAVGVSDIAAVVADGGAALDGGEDDNDEEDEEMEVDGEDGEEKEESESESEAEESEESEESEDGDGDDDEAAVRTPASKPPQQHKKETASSPSSESDSDSEGDDSNDSEADDETMFKLDGTIAAVLRGAADARAAASSRARAAEAFRLRAAGLLDGVARALPGSRVGVLVAAVPGLLAAATALNNKALSGSGSSSAVASTAPAAAAAAASPSPSPLVGSEAALAERLHGILTNRLPSLKPSQSAGGATPTVDKEAFAAALGAAARAARRGRGARTPAAGAGALLFLFRVAARSSPSCDHCDGGAGGAASPLEAACAVARELASDLVSSKKCRARRATLASAVSLVSNSSSASSSASLSFPAAVAQGIASAMEHPASDCALADGAAVAAAALAGARLALLSGSGNDASSSASASATAAAASRALALACAGSYSKVARSADAARSVEAGARALQALSSALAAGKKKSKDGAEEEKKIAEAKRLLAAAVRSARNASPQPAPKVERSLARAEAALVAASASGSDEKKKRKKEKTEKKRPEVADGEDGLAPPIAKKLKA